MNETKWVAEQNGSWIKVTETETRGEQPTKDEQRKMREEDLTCRRRARETFWTASPVTINQMTEQVVKNGPEAAAGDLLDGQNWISTLRNAQAHLQTRLRSLVAEREALEAAYRAERSERIAAEGQRRLSDQALSERCKELDAARKELRDLRASLGKPAKPKRKE